MNSNSRVNAFVFIRDLNSFTTRIEVVSYANDRSETDRERPFNHRFPIIFEAGPLQVRMSIDQVMPA
jgi:hypothetical protein